MNQDKAITIESYWSDNTNYDGKEWMLGEAIDEIKEELKVATAKFLPFRSPHEGLAVILEEFEELKAEVFKQHGTRTWDIMRKEAKQVATMALRFMIDLT